MLTERLQLTPATVQLCFAEAQGHEAVAQAVGAQVPSSWPPPVFEPDDVERIRHRLETDPGAAPWTLHYVLLRSATRKKPDLVGVAGYLEPPNDDGVVEIGYAIAAEHQRQGYATEAVQALVARAFLDAKVDVISATTHAGLAASQGVLRKAGFVAVARDQRSGLMRYEISRGSIAVL